MIARMAAVRILDLLPFRIFSGYYSQAPALDFTSESVPIHSEPRIALESTVLSHGLPYPENLNLSAELESIASDEKARACTVGIVNGVAKTDLDAAEIRKMCIDPGIKKVSTKDLPACISRKESGATTVASTVFLARDNGIRVMATGGIGGVHGDAQGNPTHDESADLHALATNPITVVCAGPKAILHLKATRERLESYSIPVVGLRTDKMPAFFCGSSPFIVDSRCESVAEVADLARARDSLGMPQAILLCVPLRSELSISYERVSTIVRSALDSEEASGLAPNEVTPFLLARVREVLGVSALNANLELLRQNTRIAAQLAVELASRG